MNKIILDQFKLLINSIKEDLNKARKNNDSKDITRNSFRLKYMLNIYKIIDNINYKLTLENYMTLKDFKGVGKGSLDRVKEILEKGKLKELKDYKNNIKDLSDLESVINIGPKLALEYYDMGATNVKKLKKMIKEGKIEVNDKVKLGLKYYKKYKMNIPRKEIDEMYGMLKKVFNDMKTNYIFELCGSYRREKATSNDIDVLITKKGKNDINHLEYIVNILKSKIKYNNNKKFIVDSMTDDKIITKFMGFCKYMDNPYRRIDIRFVPYENYYSALLYFTGSKELNQIMRKVAKNLGYKLSEYGLYKDNVMIKIKSEKDIFKKLNMDYIEPKLR